MVMVMDLPPEAVIMAAISSQLATGVPSMAVIMSPACSPAASAGEFSCTPPMDRLQDVGSRYLKNTIKDDHGQQKVECRAGGNDQHALENVLVGKRYGNVLGIHFRRGVFPHHFDKPAQGDGRNPIVGQPDLFSEQPRAEPQGKFFHAYAKKPGHQEVPQFMKKYKDAQNDNKCKNIGTHRFTIRTNPGIVNRWILSKGA